MLVLLRSLIVSLLLVALPWQGYASATMMLCAAPAGLPSSSYFVTPEVPSNLARPGAMPSGAHDHAAMMAMAAASHHAAGTAHGMHHDAGQQRAHHQHTAHADGGEGSGSHTSMKCGGAAACCAGAAPVSALALPAPLAPPASVAIAFYSRFLPAVDLAHPERPPQGPRA